MCVHCERLHDPEERRVLHEFMAMAARRMSKVEGVELEPDDIDVAMAITNPSKAREVLVAHGPALGGLLALLGSEVPDLRKLRRGRA